LVTENTNPGCHGGRQDAAMSLMTAVVPVPSAARRKGALALACEALLSHGITAVHDMGDISLGLKGHASAQRVWDDLLLLRQAQVRALRQ